MEFSLDETSQSFTVDPKIKQEYGEVLTPYSLIERMLDMLPTQVWSNPDLRWLDPACGTGYFLHVAYMRLMAGLADHIPNKKKRNKHVQGMLIACEINPNNRKILRNQFPYIRIEHDFLMTEIEADIIIGNPPYNSQGLKKVPTRTDISKHFDGKTIWTDFVRHSLASLSSLDTSPKIICMIIPAIWMKPDKANMYGLLTRRNHHLRLQCMTNTQTNQLFRGQAQTPTSILYCQVEPPNSTCPIEVRDHDTYYRIPWKPEQPIPMKYPQLVSHLLLYMRNHSLPSLAERIRKTNMPSKMNEISAVKTEHYPYANIRTCILNGMRPEWVIEYSAKPCDGYKMNKLVMAHKMYGFAMEDYGEYGISRRDSYILSFPPFETDGVERSERSERTRRGMKIWKMILNSALVRAIFETTKYRMKYLERYAFEFIPDVEACAWFQTLLEKDEVSMEEIEGYLEITPELKATYSNIRMYDI